MKHFGSGALAAGWMIVAMVVPQSLAAQAVDPDPLRPRIDGTFDEWGEPSGLDPQGDATGSLDVTGISVMTRGTQVYVRLDFAAPLNLVGSIDPTDPTLILTVRHPLSGTTIEVDFRNHSPTINGWSFCWPQADFECQPTHASSSFEMRLDLSWIGAAAGSVVEISTRGSDTTATPLRALLAGTAIAPRLRGLDRAPGTVFRVASLNTTDSGTIDPDRSPSIGRLLDAVNADIYLLQEEYGGFGNSVGVFFNGIDPKEDGKKWTSTRAGELVIVSQSPMIAAGLTTRYFGAIVRLPDGPDVLVANVHARCCGSLGSSEDSQRIMASQVALNSLERIRAGNSSSTLTPYKDVPVIVAGDWNLVGSTEPMDMWRRRAGSGPGLVRAPISSLADDDVTTWGVGYCGGLWPSRLDYVLFEQPKLFLRNAFLLNTLELDFDTLTNLGLDYFDSFASTHLVVVADFATTPLIDLNLDGITNGLDFLAFAAAYDEVLCGDQLIAAPCAADFTNDGLVDDRDFLLFVSEFPRDQM